MDTLTEVLARERRSERVACRVGADTRRYDYNDFLTTAWRSGNYLRHLGVREGVTVGVADEVIPETLLAGLGAGLLGAAAWFDPPVDADLQAVVAPATEIDTYDTRPGRKRVAYRGDTGDPAIERFEEGIWSENPTMPPERPGSEAAVLTDGDRTVTQGELLETAVDLGDEYGVDADTEVVLRAPLVDPRTVVGVLTALCSGGTVVCPATGDPDGDIAVGPGPESTVVELDQIGL